MSRLRRRSRPPEITRVSDPRGNRPGKPQPFKRILDVSEPIDEDVVVEGLNRRNRILACPFRGKRLRFIKDITQAQHKPRPACLEARKGGFKFAPQPERLLVNDEKVGRKAERRLPDQGRAKRRRRVDGPMGAQGHIVAAAQLDDAWHPDEVDARLEIEAADDRRTGYNEDPQLRAGLGQRLGYCPAASEMAQTETVVAVDQDASRSRCNDEPLGTLSVAPIRTIISATGVSARQTLLARIPAPRRADRNLMSSHKSLYSYIWQHSRRDQIVILCIALLAQPFYFLTLTLPKLIINGPIQGGGFEDPGATQAFMQLSFALPGFLPAWLSGTWTIFSGFPLERLPYLFALSLTFLALVGFNGFLKFLVNTM